MAAGGLGTTRDENAIADSAIFASLRADGHSDPPVRVEHDRLEMERFLKQLPDGTAERDAAC